MTATQEIALVVPCYNEAQRLDSSAFLAMVDEDAALSLLFVDDGSTDGTADIHATMAAQRPGRVTTMTLPENAGKAEAVRHGLLRALASSAAIVGYIDADLATPRAEIARLCETFRKSSDHDVLLGSRVRLLGRAIDRAPVRHYLGRAFATAASLLLRLPVYDTQCGAKLFRRSAALTRALQRQFLSRWVFDVELLGRLLVGAPGVPGIPVERMCEEPLQRWAHCKGSKLGARHMLQSVLDLGRIYIELGKGGRRAD